MAYDYNTLYQTTPDALGEPTKVFVDFFNALEKPLCRVLDVGCGQGRDAIFIARMGHRVVGVDLAKNGIRDLNNAAQQENLPIEGHVADITTFAPEGVFDVVLVDRTLHMLQEADRLKALGRLLDCVGDKGHLLVADETSNMKAMKEIIAAHKEAWITTFEKNGYLFIQRP
ncbi:MAG: class I SAM-dependent methyltransferase [Sneathiella sp.]